MVKNKGTNKSVDKKPAKKTKTVSTATKRAKNEAPNYQYADIIKNKGAAAILDEWNYYPDETIMIESTIGDFKNKPFQFEEAMNIVNRIVLWKVARLVTIKPPLLKRIVGFDERNIATFPQKGDQWWEQVKKTINEMVKECPGIRIAVASTILHFYHPDTFLIIDKRAYRVIMGKEMPKTVSNTKAGELYVEYMLKCIDYFRKQRLKFEFKYLDRFTYQLDREAENKVDY